MPAGCQYPRQELDLISWALALASTRSHRLPRSWLDTGDGIPVRRIAARRPEPPTTPLARSESAARKSRPFEFAVARNRASGRTGKSSQSSWSRRSRRHDPSSSARCAEITRRWHSLPYPDPIPATIPHRSVVIADSAAGLAWRPDHRLAAASPSCQTPLRLERVDDLARHVFLVVLGEHRNRR